MNLYWLEQVESDVPLADEWLTMAERTRLSTMQVPKRRADWRLGRWTAKCAVMACRSRTGRESNPAEIEVASLPSGAPFVLMQGRPADLSISLSHRAGRAICTVSSPGISIGCDIEVIEPRGDCFVEDYFTADESRVLRSAPSETSAALATVFWSAKESALKALYAGLTLDTRSVVVTLAPSNSQVHFESVHAGKRLHASTWLQLDVVRAPATILHGWYRCAGGFARTFVSDATTSPPIQLAGPKRQSEGDRQSGTSTRSAFELHYVGEEM